MVGRGGEETIQCDPECDIYMVYDYSTSEGKKGKIRGEETNGTGKSVDPPPPP